MGERLKRLRQQSGLSQNQLAKAAGVPVHSLRNWEADRRKPFLDVAAKLARAMGISLDELAGPAPEPIPDAEPQEKTAPKRPRKPKAEEPAAPKRTRKPKATGEGSN